MISQTFERNKNETQFCLGFPGGTMESTCCAGDVPAILPAAYLLGEFHEQRTWQLIVAKSQTAQQLACQTRTIKDNYSFQLSLTNNCKFSKNEYYSRIKQHIKYLIATIEIYSRNVNLFHCQQLFKKNIYIVIFLKKHMIKFKHLFILEKKPFC